MEVVKPNETAKILLQDILPGQSFSFQDEIWIRVVTARMLVTESDQLMENVVAVNIHNGSYLYTPKYAVEEVFVVPLPTAKVVVE